jgi:hypothetical protein
MKPRAARARRATIAAMTDAPLRAGLAAEVRDRDSAETVEWSLEALGTAPMPPAVVENEG